jgi:hypothetical protein
MIPDSKHISFSLHSISKNFTTTQRSSQAPEAWILTALITGTRSMDTNSPHPLILYTPLLYSPFFIWKHFFSEMCDFQIYVTPLSCNRFTLFVSFRDRSYIYTGISTYTSLYSCMSVDK